MAGKGPGGINNTTLLGGMAAGNSVSPPLSIQLGDVSAQDNLSVESAFLTVSFEDDYPQLVVMQSSSSISDSEAANTPSTARTSPTPIDTSMLDDDCLGVSYPHPAGAGGSYETPTKPARQHPITPSWMRDHEKHFWRDIDSQDFSSTSPVITPTTPVVVHPELNQWDSDSPVRWSFSNDGTATSFSDRQGGLKIVQLEDVPFDEVDDGK